MSDVTPTSPSESTELEGFALNLSELFPENSSNTTVVDIPFDRREFDGVLGVVQLLYLSNGRLPLYKEIMDRTGFQSNVVSNILGSDTFYDLCMARGIPWPSNWTIAETDGPGYRSLITPQQVIALQIVTDPSDSRSLKAKLQTAGITYHTWRNWLRDPVFNEAVRNTSEQMIQDSITTVHAAVANKASNGDIPAARLIYEVSGRHDPARQQVQDVGKLIGLMLEVITRYITDPQQLKLIANDFEVLSGGGNIKPLDMVPANYEPPASSTTVVTEAIKPGFFDFDFEKEKD